MAAVSELVKAARGVLVCGNKDALTGALSIDSRTVAPGDTFLAVKGDSFDGHDYIAQAVAKGAACVIKSANCIRYRKEAYPVIEVKDTVKALGDIARYNRRKINIPIIAITGSSGKTTAKEMVAAVLSKKYRCLKNEGTKNNHIGLPLTLARVSRDYDLAVVEIGTNHFGEVAYLADICEPNVGVIVNIGPAHLEHFGSIEGVFKEKYTLIEKLQKPAIAVLNADDNFLRSRIMKKVKKPFTVSFGIHTPSDVYATDVTYQAGRLAFRVNGKSSYSLNTLGYHHLYNALIAVSLGRVFGVEHADIAASLAAFEFPRGRFRVVEVNKVTYIDDTYNANPLSLGQALNALGNYGVKGRKVFVMGDMLELGKYKESYHFEAGRKVAETCDIFIAVGKLAKLAAETCCNYGFGANNIFVCDTSIQAREILRTTVIPREEDIVLVKGSRSMKMEEVLKDVI
ncbi:MAG TPA: UDP-N-acetylmuramoyl-tripeptide--D-alanyl-D-alanine ligase [Candidatus Omnitrophota bacterium]|nr:UDP-N-acetylmuramoyl-tripeptide--D-alanyl-D-alanine ligase [Candidatus Omnitrophota bacterium]HPT06885.1 UDP-N-acetylmuramoyl-tripeptide--D-alanyl-D-alanine ligase [Candidatus Omnitrophota bacterium]